MLFGFEGCFWGSFWSSFLGMQKVNSFVFNKFLSSFPRNNIFSDIPSSFGAWRGNCETVSAPSADASHRSRLSHPGPAVKRKMQ